MVLSQLSVGPMSFEKIYNQVIYISPVESWKSMRWRHYELLWLIRHLGPFLTQNQAGASLASLRNFFLEAKNKLPQATIVKLCLGNIFASKPLRKTILVYSPMLSGSRNQMMLFV